MKKEILKVEDMYLKIENALNEKFKDEELNYKEIYKEFKDGKNELRRDNKLNEIKEELKNLKEQIKNKKDYIYIYFKYNEIVVKNVVETTKYKFEITEDNYDYFLEVLPPLKMTNSGFLMSEFQSGNITNYFYEFKNKFYVSPVEVDREKLEKEYYGDY